MKTMQVVGKSISPTKLKSLLFKIANTVSNCDNTTGSIESNDYGLECSFVIGDSLIMGLTFSYL